MADLLVNEVRNGHTSRNRLAEARHYLEQVRYVMEQSADPSEHWMTWKLLADIAELEEQPEMAQNYRRLARESFVTFAGNRYQINRHAALIAASVAATRGDPLARALVTAALSKLEESGWHVSEGIQRIWQGERDWHALADGLSDFEALLLLHVLEIIASPEKDSISLFEPLLQAIATVARGDTSQREEIEQALTEFEAKGYHLKTAVQRLWAGERDTAVLTAGLDKEDTPLMTWVREMIVAQDNGEVEE